MKEFQAQFEAYVRACLPEWRYQRDGAETEAALMTVLWELLAASRARLELLPEKCLREYLRGFGFARQESRPMRTYAALYAPLAAAVPKGTRFYRGGDGTRIWETEEDVWAGPVRLTEHMLSGAESGKLIPLPLPEEGPAGLFNFRAGGIQRREVRFSHPSALASPRGCTAALRLEGASGQLLDFLADPERTQWSLTAGEETVLLSPPERTEGELCFQLPPCPGARALLAQVRDGQVPPAGPIGRAALRTERPDCPADAVVTEAGAAGEGPLLPFGERLSPWSCCHIACSEALSLGGGQISLAWTRTFRLTEEGMPEADREVKYRPVMRRLPQEPPPVRDVYADLAVWEYWDGRGWRSVPGTGGYTRLFSAGEAGGAEPVRQEACFYWPEDAAPCEIQGIRAFWLRWRLLSCQGAGWLPARYHAPEISHLRFEVRLEDAEASVERRSGLESGFSSLPQRRKVLFPPVTGERDGWWLGFDRPPGGGALNVYLDLKERTPGGPLSAWEALPAGGEAPLALRDGTDGLAHSGLLILGDVRGVCTLRFGHERWWVCLRDESGSAGRSGRSPTLVGLSCGAVRLRALGLDDCAGGDGFRPLQGGPVSGTALTGSFGGAAGETDRELTRRCQEQRHHLGRMVSALDAGQILCGMLRDVARIRCLREGDILQVCVLMRDTARHAAAFQLRREEIRRLILQTGALPALGLDVQVREPCFYPIHVMVWLRASPEVGFEETRRLLTKALDDFLEPAAGHFGGMGWQMGELPDAGQLRVCLRAAASGAVLVEVISTASAPDGSERETESIRDPFALPTGGSYTILEQRGADLYEAH